MNTNRTIEVDIAIYFTYLALPYLMHAEISRLGGMEERKVEGRE